MLFASALSGCFSSDTARWTEEVRSSNGTMFQLEGHAEIGSNGWPTQHRGNLHYIEYYHRPTKAYWRSPGGFNPVTFDIVNGVPYVVILVANSLECSLMNYPEQGLLIHRWNSANGWERVQSTELPTNLEMNLMQQVFDVRDKIGDAQGFISFDRKSYREGDRIGELTRWINEYGNSCEKYRKIGPVQTDVKAPEFVGFHGKPNF